MSSDTRCIRHFLSWTFDIACKVICSWAALQLVPSNGLIQLDKVCCEAIKLLVGLSGFCNGLGGKLLTQRLAAYGRINPFSRGGSGTVQTLQVADLQAAPLRDCRPMDV